MEAERRTRPFLRVMNRFRKLGVHPISSGLTRGEFFCLGAIANETAEYPEQGGVFVWKLARHMRVLPPAASRLLRDLEERELIERNVDREDRRNVKVKLTPKGQEVWQRAEQVADAFCERVLERMGEENVAQLVFLCDRLCDIIEEEQQEKENSQC